MTGSRFIHTGGGDYRENNVHAGGQYAEGNIINVHAGGQYAGGNIINNKDQKTHAEAAREIQELLDQLAVTYPINTEAGKAEATRVAAAQIRKRDSLQRVLKAGRVGALAAIEKLLDHPLAAGVVAALNDWNEEV